MKQLVFLMAFIITGCRAFSQTNDKIHWLNFEEATKKNSLSPKKIYIDVYTSWCGWCKKMDATTFNDKAIIKYMNDHFYAVKLDAETKDTFLYKNKNYSYMPEYKANELAIFLLNGKMGYPTSVYLDDKMNLIGPMQGFLKQEQLLPVLKYFAEDLYKTKNWDEYIKENFK